MKRALLLCGIVLSSLYPIAGQAASPYEAVRQGNALYRAGKYEAAARQYETAAHHLPQTADVHFNQGNAAFKMQQYTKALEHYRHALQTADAALRSRTIYNLGNVEYQQALQALATPQEAVRHLQSALTYYRDSLDGNPQQPDARYNLELAHRLLRQLQQHQPQQSPPQQQQNQQAQQSQPQPDQQARQSQPQAQQSHDRQRQQQSESPSASQPHKQQQAQQKPQEPETQQAESANQAPAGGSTQQPERSSTQPQQVQASQEMTPAEAQQLLEAIRERARQADNRRRQRQRASMRSLRVEKDW
jgi:Ca-activated chloride channel family protein